MGISLETLLTAFPCRLLCGEDLTRSITGGYACDMLSWVMSRVKQQDVWFTILNSVNVVAVASLADCACVMMTEGTEMDEQVLERARERSIAVLTTPLTTYEAAASLDRLLHNQ